MEFKLKEALSRQNDIKARLREMAQTIESENREMNDAEKAEVAQLKRESQLIDMKVMANMPTMQPREEKQDNNAVMREMLKGVRDGKQVREVTLAATSEGAKNNVNASGAVNLTIHDMIPTLNEGLGFEETGVKIMTGVTGNELYPFGINDAEMEEVGENAALTDQNLNFDKLDVTSRRTGLTITVSNSAIDNAAFDLMGYVQSKFTLATKKYLAQKLFSQANWSGNAGPFANATVQTSKISVKSKTAYKNILEAVAAFVDKGFSADKICIVIDANTEAVLKSTLKDAATAGYIIENGKLAGYNYVVSHYINTVLGGDAKTGAGNTDETKLYATTKKYMGIGIWDWEAVQQHGQVRMSIDATSKAVAIKNQTAITLNTAWSMTNLSSKINGGGCNAFAVYEVEIA